MAPPLPPVRAPLPSLVQHRQRQQHCHSDTTRVPPLRWHGVHNHGSQIDTSEETVAPVPVHEERSASEKTKRRRGIVSVDTSRSKKPASLLQREERHDLAEQVRVLQAQVDALRRSVGLPTNHDRAAIDRLTLQNTEIEETLYQTDGHLARAHAKVSYELLTPTVNPMASFIHLPRDMTQRCAILRSVQDLKLQRGVEVADAWLHHLDPTIPYLNEEKFTSATGEYHFHRSEIHQFPNFQTARQLYDVYVDFLYHLEVSVIEEIGQLTLRERVDDIDPTIWNHRIITVAEDVGITEELNFVGFAQFYNHSPHTNSPMGVIVRDTVNIDDLYPYVPESRTCKDLQCVSMLYEIPQPGVPNATLVVLKQVFFIVQLVPQFPVAANVLKQLQSNTSRWPNAYMKYLHEYVVP